MPAGSQKHAPALSTRWGGKLLQTIAAFDRLGEENAFAVLARATALQQQGKDIIKNSGLDVIAADDLKDGAQKIVKAVKG